MTKKISRRDFLKVASTASLASLALTYPGRKSHSFLNTPTSPNIIVLVYDALSALNLSLYGYPRDTSPNIKKLAERATVYHNHYASGRFTTPGTASILTGTYPWTNRAINHYGIIKPGLSSYNIFSLLQSSYYTIAFTQNILADTFLCQLGEWLDLHHNMDSFTLGGSCFYNKLFKPDSLAAMKSYDLFLGGRGIEHGSLILSLLNDWNNFRLIKEFNREYYPSYPKGVPHLPSTNISFSFDQVTNGVSNLLKEASHNPVGKPFMAYLHLLPPHGPYSPTRSFLGKFEDGWKPINKPKHPLGPGEPQKSLNELRQTYDEYILNVDSEFNRLFEDLDRCRILDNSYLILTSDHGEMFERGIPKHHFPVMYDTVTRIPLLIFAPRQRQRQDIITPTSNVDILSTMLHIAGIPGSDSCQGSILPGFGGESPVDRQIFFMDADENPAFHPFVTATVGMRRNQYKIVRYLGYPIFDNNYEMFDLDNDPEELENLFSTHKLAKDLQDQLNQALIEADRPYVRA